MQQIHYSYQTNTQIEKEQIQCKSKIDWKGSWVIGQSISSFLSCRARKMWAPCSLWLLKLYLYLYNSLMPLFHLKQITQFLKYKLKRRCQILFGRFFPPRGYSSTLVLGGNFFCTKNLAEFWGSPLQKVRHFDPKNISPTGATIGVFASKKV